MMNVQAAPIDTKHPSSIDGSIKAWNTFLKSWDTLLCCNNLEPNSLWPEWIRLKDGKHFKTPPNDAVYPQPK